MSGTGKRGADKLNIISVVVIGLCGAILTYVSIVALEAYYMDHTSSVERTKAHEAPNSMRNRIQDLQKINLDGTKEGTLAIEEAKKLVIADAQRDPSVLIPGKPSVKPTVEAQYGRPATLQAAPPPAPVDPVTPPPVDPATPPVDPATPPQDPTTPPADGATATKPMTKEEAEWWAKNGQKPPATEPAPTTPPAGTTPGSNGP
jgi:hypothetical protein